MIGPEFIDVPTSTFHDVGGTADKLAYRLVELQCSPIRGGFDTAHLQNIHHFLYHDISERAGELRTDEFHTPRAARLEQALDGILDRLAAENYLRGIQPTEWTTRASEYVYEIGSTRPFAIGNAVTLREFASEVARKNHLTLRWERLPDTADEKTFAVVQQQTYSMNLRRLIML